MEQETEIITESQEEIAQPVVDKLPDLCINCSRCYWKDGEDVCSGDCKQN